MSQTNMPTPENGPPPNVARTLIESVLFNVKWLLPVFYLGLLFILLLYGYVFLKELVAAVRLAATASTEQMQIVVLNFVDIVMIANLAKMIITGSYNSFVSKAHGHPNENISSGTLKIKITTSVVVVGSIHLLREMVDPHSTPEVIQMNLWIFAAFLGATLVLGVLEYLHVRGMSIESQIESRH
jgi:uncharacterized protein (TIGR00645 family)